MAFGEVQQCDISRKRGDRKPLTFTLTEDGVPIPVAGYTALLTINSIKDPDLEVSPNTGTQIFQASGGPATSPLPSPADGRISIDMSMFGNNSPSSDDVQPGSYFYDIEVTDADGFECTVLEGKFVVRQDITK